MNNDLISRDAVLKEIVFCCNQEIVKYKTMRRALGNVGRVAFDCAKNAPAVDAEVVRHEGNTTFVETNNLDAYADRIIVGQGNICKVYYADEPVRHGRWILEACGFDMYQRTTDCVFRCSECGLRAGNKYPYCHCGAKMDAEVK